jgi:hypothetical protein
MNHYLKNCIYYPLNKGQNKFPINTKTENKNIKNKKK